MTTQTILKNAKIVSLKRLNNSSVGNPNYLVTLRTIEGDFLTLKTSSNAGCVYELPNYENKEVELDIYLTKAERISMIKKS